MTYLRSQARKRHEDPANDDDEATGSATPIAYRQAPPFVAESSLSDGPRALRQAHGLITRRPAIACLPYSRPTAT